MKKLGIRATCAAAAAALSLSFGTADAVVYSSAFDPPNFRGTATFDVSQPCLSAGNGFQTSGGPPAGCTVGWLGATITFQDAPTLTFDYSALLPDADTVSLIWVEEGELAGVISDAIGAVVIGGHSNASFNAPWWIQFAFAPAGDPAILHGPPSNGLFGLGVVYLYTGTCAVELECIRNPDPVEVAQVEFFERVAQVPEPGTLALTLAALVGAGFARRRTRPAA